MKSLDILQGFLFEHHDICGQIASLNKTYTQIISQKNYPPVIKKLLGEALVACLLLTANTKFEGRFSLQFQGDPRLPLIVVQCDHELTMRVLANYQENLSDEDYQQAFLKGQMVLTIKHLQQKDPYQSIVPIQSLSMSENLMHYYTQSEQLLSHVYIAISDTQVAGLLLQALPNEDTEARERFWEYAVMMSDSLTDPELLSLDHQTILQRLYHETELKLYPERKVEFKCQCSLQRMRHVIYLLGEKECQDSLEECGNIDVHCDFCNQHYVFDSIDVAMIFKQAGDFKDDTQIIAKI